LQLIVCLLLQQLLGGFLKLKLLFKLVVLLL